MEKIKIDTELRKSDWERSLMDNVGLIINNKMQMQMAFEVIELCKKKIAEFPEDKVEPAQK